MRIRNFLCLIVSLFLFTPLCAQMHSTNGHIHTPKGKLHVLLIFVRYENTSKMTARSWPDETQEGVLPSMALGKNNELFTEDPDSVGLPGAIQNLSDYYYSMSGGQFILTGEIFPIQVPVRFISSISGQVQMNKEAIKWIAKHFPDYDWGRFDNRTNFPRYFKSNVGSPPDSILDYVIFMHRNQGSGGIGSPGIIEIPGSEYKIRHGHSGFLSYADAPHNWEYFKHEFSHNLFSAPHYCGANDADGLRFYTQKGWGLMSAWHAPFFTSNAWENWWLGWIEPQEITETMGTYQLKDFVTGRDAISIPIPGTQDVLWLENHQKKSRWDKKLFFGNPSRKEPQSAKGLYAYVVAKPGKSREQPSLNPFNKEHVNILKMLNAEGNFDIAATDEKLSNGFFETTVMQKLSPNPFSGQNDFQFIRQDYDRNGRIDVGRAHGNRDRGALEQKSMWSERKKKKNILTLGNTGDGNDAFQTGDIIGLDGKIPVTNYPLFNSGEEGLEPYLMNGIRIELLSQDEEGTFTLDIQLDNWKVNSKQRWSGNLLLDWIEGEESTHMALELWKKARVKLAPNLTPDRRTPHPENGTFSNPTQLLIKDRILTLSKGSILTIEKGSRLILQEHSTLIIEKGGKLIILDGGSLEIGGDSILSIERGGKLKIESEAILLETENGRLTAENGGRIQDQR